MSSPLPAAPSGSPPDVAASPPSTASPPASSSTVPPSSSSSTPPAPPPSGDQTPPAPPPSGGDQTPPAAPPPSETPSPPPPVIVSTSPPPSSSSSPPPPSATDSTPPPSTSTPPPPSTSTSPPPPVQSLPPPAAQSAPPPGPSEEPAPPQSSSPPPPSSAQSPPISSSSPPPPSQSSLSPPSPPSSVSPPPPPSSTLSSPPPPPASTSAPTTPSSPSSPTTPSSPTSPPSSNSTAPVSGGTLAAILITGVLAASILLVLVYCFCKKKKKRYYAAGGHHGPPGGLPAHYQDSYYTPNMKQQQGWHSPQSQSSDHVLLNMPPPPPPLLFTSSEHDLVSPEGNSGIGNSFFTYAELAKATNGFSKSNMLGEGGFGCVYKGVLSNGQVVAVKQLKIGASQGEKEFQAEVEIISRVHHRHLVSLVGYCTAESQRLLVYDYVPNNTLEYHLHKRKGGPVMDWATRIRVASGAARGLAYLHEDCHPRIIHRDIKSSNILLDNNFEAQVSDFGLAKLTSDTNTHVTTRVMGTFGYLAPEYASSGKLTEKSDVFSFGVVLLELLTGRKPVDVSQPPGQESVVEWARPLLAQVESEEDLDMLVDPSLNGVYDSKEMMRMAEAAAACVRHSANKRPRMGQVVRALEDEISLSDLNRGLKPGHSSVYGSSFSSNDYENGSYSADMRRFRMALNETNDMGVSMNPSVSSSEYQTSLEIDQDTRRPMRMPRHAAFSSSNELSAGN